MLANQTNLIKAALALVRKLEIRITKQTLHKIIEQNPYYPSLFSLSDVFNRFKIPNQSFKLSVDQFQELEAPFIAFWKNDFVTVMAKNKDTITYMDLKSNKVIVSLETFLKDYKNIVFVAEADVNSGDPEFEKVSRSEARENIKRKLLTASSLLVLGIILFQFLSVNNTSAVSFWHSALVSIAKLIGLSVSLLLLRYESDKSNALVKNFCSAGKQTSCDAVLNSKAGRILGFSWGEIGFCYFATSMLFLIFPGLALTNKLVYLVAASVLVSPYILFSLYYQWRVVKRWCPLCLVAQFALFMELLWSLAVYSKSGNWSLVFNSQVLAAILISILLPIISWNLIKPLLLKLKQTDGYEAAYKRLLYHPEIFNAMLQSQPEAPDGWRDIGITVGNPGSTKTIIKVCNPYCGPCAKAHPLLEEIITRNPDFNLKVIFTSTNNPQDRGGVVARHLLAIARQGNVSQTQKALDDWYNAGQKDYEVFSSKYPLNGEIENQKEKVEAMQEWCMEASITHTPTIFVDGKRLPQNYSLNELQYILRN